MRQTPPWQGHDVSYGRSLETSIQIELEGIDAQLRPIDGVGTQVAQPHPDPTRETKVADEVIASGIGSTPMEIGVCVGVDDGIALQVSIAQDPAPCTGGQNLRVTKTHFGLIALRAGRHVDADIGGYIRGV